MQTNAIKSEIRDFKNYATYKNSEIRGEPQKELEFTFLRHSFNVKY